MMQKHIIAASASVIGILLFVAFAALPLLRGIYADSRSLEMQYLEVLKASLAEQEVADFLRFSEGEASGFGRINALFVDAETPVGFIRFLEGIAASLNLELRITPGNPRKEKGVPWPVMDFQLVSSASYPEFAGFLVKLENGPYLLEVRNASVTRERAATGEEQDARDISFILQVQVFTGPVPASL
ncbi:MAG: hypothetical protein Q8P12_00370 [bacterium]|nr:hypothetical protein [bacterium]